ncbi:hypothetical protein GCM10011390_06080 [Aureimonas endophytica]|uniref:Uncharacterized protein n=1 Tax=Aureimonas endophytica TaxID=2027858 RepID=A0A917E101_9HYPH|nr:hypothetical protein GCM10011390_06080 [Aureimonas endophytica]
MIANIDPVFGTSRAGEECAELIRAYDPQAEIFHPNEAGFAAAVARVWAASRAEIVLHLEDDWLLRKPVAPADILPFFAEKRTAQVSFNHANKNWDIAAKGPFCTIKRSRRLFGLALPMKIRIPNFLTSPSFYRGSVARSAARLLDPRFDPEKQFCRGLNPSLEAHVLRLRNRVVGEIGDYFIEDLGRAWRETRGIEKHLLDGQSVWSEAPPSSHAPDSMMLERA